MSVQAAALLGLGVLWAFALVLVLSLCKARAKPTPSPTSLQGTADRLRALGDDFDAMFTEPPAPAEPRGSGWVVPSPTSRGWRA